MKSPVDLGCEGTAVKALTALPLPDGGAAAPPYL